MSHMIKVLLVGGPAAGMLVEWDSRQGCVIKTVEVPQVRRFEDTELIPPPRFEETEYRSTGCVLKGEKCGEIHLATCDMNLDPVAALVNHYVKTKGQPK